MPSPNWNDDDELMGDLAMALRVPPVDERILHAARGAFAWRTVDADLDRAALFYDSALEVAGGVRGQPSGAPRTLAFQGERLGVELELSDGGGIEGQLIPAQPGEVTLVTPDGQRVTVAADEVGCFSFPTLPRGPVRLQCRSDGGRCTTEWVSA